jgi:hypothetical protein
MGTYATMSSDAPDARVLLEVAPDQYVAERTRVVKQARADKDKERAGFYQSLKRPSVALWAALVAADAEVVHKILTVTAELGAVQASGATPADLSSATKRRRTTLEASWTVRGRWQCSAAPDPRSGLVDRVAASSPNGSTAACERSDEQFGSASTASRAQPRHTVTKVCQGAAARSHPAAAAEEVRISLERAAERASTVKSEEGRACGDSTQQTEVSIAAQPSGCGRNATAEDRAREREHERAVAHHSLH